MKLLMLESLVIKKYTYKMDVIETSIPDVVKIVLKVFADSRGYFFESFSEREFVEKVCNTRFVQDNESRSCYGVLRGLHFQKPPFAQSKLIRVIKGKILDVAVDIRKGSPTYGKYVAIYLSGDNKEQLFIPKGFAHGFSVHSQEAVIQYKCDSFYAPESEGAIAWNDSALSIDWGLDVHDIILSDKDKCHPTLAETGTPFSYDTNYYR